MKARNKVTGKVVSNFGWSKEYGTICYTDKDGNVLQPSCTDEWELLNDVDWDAYRREVAKSALLKMLMPSFGTDEFPSPQEVCANAVLYADELIKQLQDKAI